MLELVGQFVVVFGNDILLYIRPLDKHSSMTWNGRRNRKIYNRSIKQILTINEVCLCNRCRRYCFISEVSDFNKDTWSGICENCPTWNDSKANIKQEKISKVLQWIMKGEL